MEIDHWKFPQQGIPPRYEALSVSRCSSASISAVFPLHFAFLFYFSSDCVPLIKCGYIQREGFYLFKIFFSHARRLVCLPHDLIITSGVLQWLTLHSWWLYYRLVSSHHSLLASTGSSGRAVTSTTIIMGFWAPAIVYD